MKNDIIGNVLLLVYILIQSFAWVGLTIFACKILWEWFVNRVELRDIDTIFIIVYFIWSNQILKSMSETNEKDNQSTNKS